MKKHLFTVWVLLMVCLTAMAVPAIYGPSQASFSTENGLVTITCETDYPFSDILTFKVSGDEGASIPLTLRIPGWCYWARAEINGVEYPRSLYAGSFVTVSEGVKPGDVITLTLPMRAETNSVEGQGVYFERGPLLYAYAIPQQMTEDTEEYANMHGKKPENPDFKCWNITPTGDFNYAYATDGEKIKLLNVQVEKKDGMIPFDDNCAPVNLRIPVKKIAWELEDGRYTPALPEQGTLTLLSDETQYINLVPYGSTELRLTVFPDADAEPLDEPEEEDYSRPDDAPECVEVVDGSYYAYFELPRFCWDEPIYCKVRTEDGDEADMWSSQGGDACQLVGTTDNGRHIWRWTDTADTEPIPVEIIFTNHDLLTEVMPFINGGYYIYDCPLYQAGPYVPTGIGKVYDDGLLTTDNGLPTTGDGVVYDLQGRMVGNSQSLHNGLPKGIYICNGRKIVRK